MPFFDTLQRASFDGIPFFIESVSVKGGLRRHVHEYPHRAGGKSERLGRRLYEIRFAARFEAGMAAWPDLYPDALIALREKFENETVGELVIPTVGIMNAYCYEWEQETVMGESLSGERAPLVFCEEQRDDLDAIAAFVGKSTVNSLETDNADFQEEAKKADPDLLQQIGQAVDDLDNAVGDVLAIRDDAATYGALLESKILRVANICEEIDRTISDPTAARLIDALHEVWSSAETALKDILGQKSELQTFTTPTLMAIGEVSTKLYGDTSHSIELLQMNPIDDADEIPANTAIRYYPTAA